MLGLVERLLDRNTSLLVLERNRRLLQARQAACLKLVEKLGG